MISERKSDNIPPQMKILNMVIPILVHYLHFLFKKTVKMYFVAPIRPASQLHKTACQLHIFTCQPMKARLRNDVGFPKVYRRIYSRKFMTLSKQTSHCICKCIIIINIQIFIWNILAKELLKKDFTVTSRTDNTLLA